MVRFSAAVGLAIVTGVSTGCAVAVGPTDSSPVMARRNGVATADPLLDDFHARVDRYMKLHHGLRDPALDRTEAVSVAANQASRQTLAARIRLARVDARQGEIFTPPTAIRVRQLLNPEVRGAAAADARQAIRDDAPAKFTLHVNDAYPAGASLPTMPGRVLAALPSLPAGLEYRIVDRHLILLDVSANIIVDYMFDVMCGVC